ncbi:T9SS type A sorting domain-containing protein [Algoriphagus sp. SE2]|uniref:T9SS type A sorting domain-containing protein n=1 Tax=Algoriphagus sp. SE2 TaxID=3141536 RepID=UPI0031CD831D
MLKRIPILFLFFLACISAQGSVKYASPSGDSSNSGIDENNPWSLDFALGVGSPLVPGDSLILLDGTYEGNFQSYLNGTSANPIFIVSQNDGMAIIDAGKNKSNGTGLLIYGSHTWFVGLKVTSSSTVRSSDASNGFAEIKDELGITVFGDNIKIINCWVYDIVGGGIELWRNGFNNEVYGSIIFNNGSQGDTRGNGHGFYVQHQDENQPKILENNIVFQNASQGINLYTTDPENKGMKVIRNVSFNTGVIATVNFSVHRPPHNFTVGSRNNLSSEVVITDNVFYRDLQGSRLTADQVRNVTLGRTYMPNENISFSENLIYGGGNLMEILPLNNLEIRSNQFYNAHGNFYAVSGDKTSFPNANWNSNFFFNLNNQDKPFNGLTFDTWKANFGFDLASQFSPDPITDQEVLITRNKYDPTKFYVTILKLNSNPEAAVDFSEFQNLKGKSYEIIDFQNPFDPTQNVEGVYQGNAISFPMNWEKSMQPNGNMPFQVVHTDRTFGTFMVKFESLEDFELPKVKESIEIFLDEVGRAQVQLSDLLESFGSFLPEEFTLSKTEIDCSDTPETTIKVTGVNVSSSQEWVEEITMAVLDTITPVFEEKFTPVDLNFDKSIGELVLNPLDFFTKLPVDNCGLDGIKIELSQSKITCADIDSERLTYPVFFDITVSDRSGNSRVFPAAANLKIGESKKVSIEATGTLYQGGSVELRLGNELEYEVLEWRKNSSLVPDQIGKTLVVTTPGLYTAWLMLANGCMVDSEIFEVLDSEVPFPPVKDVIELALNENGTAELSKDQIFIDWPISDDIEVSLSQSKFSCQDLGENFILVTLSKSDGSKQESEILVKVVDEIPPVLDWKSAEYSFDLSKGELVFDVQDFIVSPPTDNCGSEGLQVSLSKTSVTCADVDSELVNYPIDVDIIVTDASGNTSVYPTYALLVFTESQKVSLTAQGTLYEGRTVELRLGEELNYDVWEWRKDLSQISGEKGNSIIIDSPGRYTAVLALENGCLVSSETLLIEVEEVPFPPVKEAVNLELNEQGIAKLEIESVFESWPFESSGFSFDLSQSEFDCADIGDNIIQLQISAEDGAEWTFDISVFVEDKLGPILETKNLELELDLTIGSLELKAEDFIELLEDNCEIKELTINRNSIDCESVGKEIQVELRAVDGVGNVTEKSAVVTVKSLVTKPVIISGPESICVGESGEIKLTSEALFEVVRWRRNGDEIEGQTGKVLPIEEGGIYHAVIRYEGGCLFETEKIEIESFEKPSGEIEEDGNILRAPEGYEYQWFRNGEILPEETERTIVLSQMGLYTVELTNEAGCKAMLPAIEVTISGILGGKIESQELKIYPNPVSSEVTVEATGDLEFAESSWKIYDMNGRNLNVTIQVLNQTSTRLTFDVSDLANGTYLITVESTQSKIFLGRIIKMK